MPPRIAKRRESLTPEEQLARALRAKWRFRAAVRFLIRNIYWLEDVSDQQLGQDIQKNILLLTRKKEKKSLLSLSDKAILNKPAEYRTEAEKLHLSRIIGGLKCFRRYPSHVKSALAGVTYFYYFGPGRMIVRQGDEANSLYFVITGDITISQNVFDPLLNQMVRQDIAVMGPGSMFGEVSLLHEIPRTATIMSNTHVELLCLKKQDFDLILKSTVKQQWEEIKSAMGAFTYFDDWDDIAIRECCIVAKMKAYSPDQTILGDGYGLRDYVYFVLKGRCRIIEHLLVIPQVNEGGRKVYKLYVPQDQQSSCISKSASFKSEKENSTVVKDEPSGSNIVKIPLQTAEGSEGIKKNAEESASGKVETSSAVQQDILIKISSVDMTKSITESASTKKSEKKSSATDLLVGNVIKPTAKPTQLQSALNLPSNVETHFMKVCFLNETACFGIGENQHHRRIVATQYTECLLIPRYWLMQKNKANIWNRVQQFLNNHIPTTKQVFKRFVNERKWITHRRRLVDDILAQRKPSNDNTSFNIPYFIRIHEELDDLD